MTEKAKRHNMYRGAVKKGTEKLIDLNDFNVWFEANFNRSNVPIPKIISFKEHVRILCERDTQYQWLLNEYNELVDKYNALVEKEGAE